MAPPKLTSQLIVTVGEHVGFHDQLVSELALGREAPTVHAWRDTLDDRSGTALRAIGGCWWLVREGFVRADQGVESSEEPSCGLERGSSDLASGVAEPCEAFSPTQRQTNSSRLLGAVFTDLHWSPRLSSQRIGRSLRPHTPVSSTITIRRRPADCSGWLRRRLGGRTRCVPDESSETHHRTSEQGHPRSESDPAR
jgi:hypothetical protein